jgi:hypothetical protein
MRTALNILGALKRSPLGLVLGLAVVAAVTAGSAVNAPSANAALCRTAGHVYLTQPGKTFMSGFEGDQRFGVPTASFVQGSQSFRIGGNGLLRSTQPGFRVVDANGNTVGPNINPSGRVRDNCVLNEYGPFTFSMPPGNYQVLATYRTGNTGQDIINEPVVNLNILPAPPPPPWEPPPYENPCGPNGNSC